MAKVLIGGRKVTWRYGYIGGDMHVYIGIKDVDNINDGKYDLEHAIKFVIAKVEDISDVNAIQLIKY